jgi:hypothetical protein
MGCQASHRPPGPPLRLGNTFRRVCRYPGKKTILGTPSRPSHAPPAALPAPPWADTPSRSRECSAAAAFFTLNHQRRRLVSVQPFRAIQDRRLRATRLELAVNRLEERDDLLPGFVLKAGYRSDVFTVGIFIEPGRRKGKKRPPGLSRLSAHLAAGPCCCPEFS